MGGTILGVPNIGMSFLVLFLCAYSIDAKSSPRRHVTTTDAMALAPEYDDDGALITDKPSVSKSDIFTTISKVSSEVKDGSSITKEAYPYRKEYRKIAFTKLPSQRLSVESESFTHASRTSIFAVKYTKPKSKQKLTTPRMIPRQRGTYYWKLPTPVLWRV